MRFEAKQEKGNQKILNMYKCINCSALLCSALSPACLSIKRCVRT